MLIIGLLIAFAGNSFVFALHNDGTFEVFNQGEQLSSPILDLKNWLFGIIGATMVGFNVMAIFIIRFALKEKEIWAWNALFYGIIVWFIIDSGISFYYAAYFNLYLINIPALLTILIPLFFIRVLIVRNFQSNHGSDNI
ncbi:hypothetical protein [Aquiflexum sp.]|uniref:hypothetical protein n=1 Tax=Aquiflexum sp. TaxID=1872584 RepID=UPI0035943A6D